LGKTVKLLKAACWAVVLGKKLGLALVKGDEKRRKGQPGKWGKRKRKNEKKEKVTTHGEEPQGQRN